jgi:hypothetical protein
MTHLIVPMKRSLVVCLLVVIPFTSSVFGRSAAAQQATPAPSSSQPAPVTPGASGQNAPAPQQEVQRPVGTAAAPAVEPEGVPGSRPSGAAIAPGKQKRNHSFAIRTAVVIAAVVAVGIVAGVSLGSPSHSH